MSSQEIKPPRSSAYKQLPLPALYQFLALALQGVPFLAWPQPALPLKLSSKEAKLRFLELGVYSIRIDLARIGKYSLKNLNRINFRNIMHLKKMEKIKNYYLKFV